MNFRPLKVFFGLTLLFFLTTCGGVSTTTGTGSSGSSGGASGGDDEETKDSPQAGPPSTPAEIPSNLGSLVEKAGSALVNDFQPSKFSSDLSLNPAVSFITPTSRFNTYVTTNGGSVLTDVFGPKDGESVETNIRAILAEAAERIRIIRLFDQTFTCTHTIKLEDKENIPIAFYGTITNGPTSNRYFDCWISLGTNKLDVYGRDADNVLRIVSMSKVTAANTRLVDRRGTNYDRYLVIFTTYHETATASGKTVFLDVQYVTANLFTGPDNSYSSKSDNGHFRVRGRISGRVLFDQNDAVTEGRGEFRVTAGNVEPNNLGGFINQYVGRGGFRTNEISIFNVNSDFNADTTADAGTYCIQASSIAGGIPSSIGSSNCSTYESAFGWADATLPFTPNPVLQSKFEEISFFKDNNTDMIADDGSNFSIPNY